MTIDGAIICLGLMTTPHKDAQLPMDMAIKLGIEALEAVRNIRAMYGDISEVKECIILPSETE